MPILITDVTAALVCCQASARALVFFQGQFMGRLLVPFSIRMEFVHCSVALTASSTSLAILGVAS
jgi:hypothetical protein